MRFEAHGQLRPRRTVNITVSTGNNETRVVILGAGPAGLTAAYELSNLGTPCVVLEQDRVVGGLARTVEYKDSASTSEGTAFTPKFPWCNKSGVTFSATISLPASVSHASTTNRDSSTTRCNPSMPFAAWA